MNIDFALILSLLVIITGLVTVIDFIFFDQRRKSRNKKMPVLIEYSRSFFPVLLLVWGVRSFLVQPYRVPTGSLEPTVMPGDFIVVNQFSYGLHLPVFHKKILNVGKPKIGDIALFYWPPYKKLNFVKRVIGTPGDHVIYRNKQLIINDKMMPQTLLGDALDIEPNSAPIPVEKRQEQLGNVSHQIFVKKEGGEIGNFDIVVPKGMYFMMGDNRDNSDDSRTWGFVPEENLIGKAFAVWMSWDTNKKHIRWNRIGKRIH